MQKNTIREWLYPLGFTLCFGWVLWHMPVFILDLIPPESQSMHDQISALHARKDVTPGFGGVFGGVADIIDWLALLLLPVLFVLGARSVKIAPMERQIVPSIDYIALFVGRVTMMLIISMTLVMLYEVFVRYVLNAGTEWANELTLWIAGFVFLCSGLYAMQQRCHIRIFLIYDMVPRGLQRVFDTLSTLLIVVFAFFLAFGSYKQVFINKFYKWEMFGTAFDPPIPATVQPMILIIITLIAIQAVLNLINDWNEVSIAHQIAEDIDEDELQTIKRRVGAK